MSNDARDADDPDVLAGSTAGGLTVELWTQRSAVGPRETVVDRLRGLRDAGVLTDFTVEIWPEEIPLTERNDGRDPLATIERYEAWAEERDLRLRPPFETRTSSLLVGGSETVLVTPSVLAAVSVDGDLAGVYPATRDGRTWTVTDLLDALDPAVADAPGTTADFPGIGRN